MKLRLRGDSLRFRLSKSEVTSLRDQGWWESACSLTPAGDAGLVYRVESAPVEKPSVRYEHGPRTVVTAVLPAAEVKQWSDSSQVGLYFDESWGLKVAIEKDFQCLDPRRDEDESDSYDNPLAGESRHVQCHGDE
jgi:hypothetical protein